MKRLVPASATLPSRENFAVFLEYAIYELQFPSPYLLHAPTLLVEHRSLGPTGVSVTSSTVLYDEPFELELRAFHSALATGALVVTPPEEAREDIRLLLEAHAVATMRC
jgi:predicted dehydrogenase